MRKPLECAADTLPIEIAFLATTLGIDQDPASRISGIAARMYRPRKELAGMLHPRLQDLRFVREITNKRGQILRATIGQLIEPAELLRFASDDDAAQFLRQETLKLSQTE